MQFKVDENLPAEIAELLVKAGYDAKTVNDQQLQGTKDRVLFDVCKKEERILVTLDLDFSDIKTYPPRETPGLIIVRVSRHSKLLIIEVFQKIIPLLSLEPLKQHLWIVEEARIRIRGAEKEIY